MDFSLVERITGEVITSLIIRKLECWGLDIGNCRGHNDMMGQQTCHREKMAYMVAFVQ